MTQKQGELKSILKQRLDDVGVAYAAMNAKEASRQMQLALEEAYACGFCAGRRDSYESAESEEKTK